ncbi:M1 family aminopeptidase [Chryseobacterium sp.]|uniref:M1 family aminopeptidase n=1 Tax=Chryseobacterium sp. TaxID=1871047 RepID=UPI0031DEDDAF
MLRFIFILLVTNLAVAQQPSKEDSLVGSLTPEKSWWNLLSYDITIKPDYRTKTITGNNQIKYKVISEEPTELMQIDLIKPLVIDSVIQNGRKLSFQNKGNIWYVSGAKKRKNKKYTITVYYSGAPVESLSPPWDGGFVWSKNSLNRPWISVACQYKGASLWYPCKNMLYDETDEGASISIITPASLNAIGNGRLVKQQRTSDGDMQYTWKVVNPINHYGISFYMGNYVNIKKNYTETKGKLSMDYWVLDYNKQKVEDHLIPKSIQAMKSLEHWFGSYPFYEDGFKIVEAPYIGMEHQSAIAYGNNFTKGTYKGNDVSKTGWGKKKADRIVIHEMSHEWFGNSITAGDIADRWIQEGFAGLAEELLLSDLFGKKAGRSFFQADIEPLKMINPSLEDTVSMKTEVQTDRSSKD